MLTPWYRCILTIA
jgi:hypothetical protein